VAAVSEKPVSFGGVVIDRDGRILLREPTGRYGGAGWTFPKGHPTGAETEEETALRETREETGVVTEIVARIPGVYEGTTTRNVYFLMRPVRSSGEPLNETAGVRWVGTPEEARRLIAGSPSRVVRGRDLAVLEAALTIDRQARQGG
jgi:ADP-ribose pyrophosphatase YjhB (NUDIX family)